MTSRLINMKTVVLALASFFTAAACAPGPAVKAVNGGTTKIAQPQSGADDTIAAEPMSTLDKAFIKAALDGRWNKVKAGIEKGADVNARSRQDQTALHYAIYHDNLDMVKFLAEKGADVNDKKKDGSTLLHYAAWYGRPKIVEYLVSSGVELNAKDDEGKTALNDAINNLNWDIVIYLLQHGADGSAIVDFRDMTALHVASLKGDLDEVKTLAAKGADIMGLTEYRNTPLHYAVQSGSLDVVKFLVGKGADLNIKDNLGRTVLDYAKEHDKKDVVELLESMGAL